MDSLSHLLDAPVANIFIIAGIAFLGIGAVGKITGKIEPDKGGRIVCALLGVVLLLGGVYAHVSGDNLRGTKSDDSQKAPVASVEPGEAVSGRWNFTTKSDVSGNAHQGIATLAISGS